MSATVQLRPVETPHDDATICDFDELPESAKDDVLSAVGSGETVATVSHNASPLFDTCDVVRFTEYYRVKTE